MKIKQNVTLDEEVVAALIKLAAEEGRSKSNMANLILRIALIKKKANNHDEEKR